MSNRLGRLLIPMIHYTVSPSLSRNDDDDDDDDDDDNQLKVPCIEYRF
jgi:hypothetical protein